MKLEAAIKKIKFLLDKFAKENNEELKYALIGGLAVSAWGAIRATKDIDFLLYLAYPAAKESLREFILSAGFSCDLKESGFSDPVPALLEVKIPVEKETVVAHILLATKKWQIDFLNSEISLNVGGISIPVLRAEELIAMKLKAGSALDIFDAKELLRILKGTKWLDIKKLQDEAKSIGVDKKLARALEDMQ